ncbi:MAG: EF-hand domain-containing protein [Nitrosospira sp.]|nr:EF-hand domain-containing protein [Nitrosospira sp.]
MSHFSTLPNKTMQLFIVAAVLIFSISCPVHATTPAESKPGVIPPPWELYDTDKDDYISAEEAAQQKMPAETFKSLDIDRDGRLNKDEFSKAPPIKIN